jgi:V/A-type H+/Na+-transporting ATPase subunit K
MVKLLYWRIGSIGAVFVGIILLGTMAMAQETTKGGGAADLISAYRAIGLGAAAALAIAVSILGAGYAVGRIGSAALGAAAEKPELLTRSILFVALAEGLAVLGFAIAMMLIQKI